ncbi:glycoside hydrolase [Vibrio brasiliensis]|uniref:glycoside hydrolase n=1 Tax=Vibrio brasiliensis TaxID=170652 RepID=UPI001EFC998E|nr:glycoside hydrolase [Vibrio brasiliensis]MCG9651068.1 glycoside hydrolase [Vibrio brasiliensis]
MNKPISIALLLTGVTLSFFATGADTKSNPSNVITLRNGEQSVTINPGSLKIDWYTATTNIPITEPALLVKGTRQQASQVTQASTNSASWLLEPSNMMVSATFDKGLRLSFELASKVAIARNNPLTLKWFDLPEQQAHTLLMPFNEGMRIPTDNKVWMKYMESKYSNSNTTQDLKMPFWSVGVASAENQYVSYQLLNPTNNQLNFSISNHKLDMQAEHHFTMLNRHERFEVLITLGSDQLDGAKHYRDWRKQQGLATPLPERLVKQPQLKRLIGASHVYLFGHDVLAVEDVKDWWGLKEWYFDQATLIPTREAQKELSKLKKGKHWLNKYQKGLLVESINLSLAQLITVEQTTPNENGIKQQFEAAQKRKMWLVENANAYLIDAEYWGQALSKGMIDNLVAAGLSKLWLGLDNWMPAFYQPQVVDQAKQAGYLIGTYDSYNTAIAKGINDSWLTAQLPDAMREQCAIEKANGQKKKGFRGNGFYLNPICERDYVEQRIQDIVHFGRFNSLFLDVDATAMAREDYSQGRRMNETQMLDAFNQRMQWIASNQDVVLGSEDGNSLTTQGIAFAHGMETVGFGWTDKDMKNNRKSPYFLGAWFPNHKPDFFFKPAQVKQPYKNLFFSPQYKVPLYQIVFHDELINSHHWHTDSLKFSDVQIERDLTSMLYNTPSMVHLSRDEAERSSAPRIKALQHYQQGFLPIHKALWDKAMTGFKWLDEQGLLQQTTFSDGSVIYANFSQTDKRLVDNRLIPATSIVAILSNHRVIEWTPIEHKLM